MGFCDYFVRVLPTDYSEYGGGITGGQQMKLFLTAHGDVNGGALYIKATIKMNTTGIWIGGYV